MTVITVLFIAVGPISSAILFEDPSHFWPALIACVTIGALMLAFTVYVWFRESRGKMEKTKQRIAQWFLLSTFAASALLCLFTIFLTDMPLYSKLKASFVILLIIPGLAAAFNIATKNKV